LATCLEGLDSVLQQAKRLGLTDSPTLEGETSGEFTSAIPWFVVTEIDGVASFLKWLDVIARQPHERCHDIFACDLARDGFKMAVDRLWMLQHETPLPQRDFVPILAAYDVAATLCRDRGLRVFGALVERARIVVEAEYLKHLPRAVSIASDLLAADDNDEVTFLISDVIGRQYSYANQFDKAIEHLSLACATDTGTFDGIRCRTFIELSRAIGDDNCAVSFEHAKTAVAIAKRRPDVVPELDMISALGEAAIAAGVCKDYGHTFDYLDEAFTLLARDVQVTVEWKMRFVILGNALGYFTSLAATGTPPSDDFTVPPRGHLVTYNEVLAAWYDEAQYDLFDLSPTLLATFAIAVGNHERALHWAILGIEQARRQGVLVSIYSLAEMMIPDAIARDEPEQALDYAFEASTALVASYVARQRGTADVRERGDVNELLGAKPSEHWDDAEEIYIFTGVMPLLWHYCIHHDSRRTHLQHLATDCEKKANKASQPQRYRAIIDGINDYLAGASSRQLHDHAQGEERKSNRAGALAYYILSSCAIDSDPRHAVIQQAVLMHQWSSKIIARSALWKFLTQQLCESWRNRFKEQRFRFLNPIFVELALQNLDAINVQQRAKNLIRIVLRGLSVQLPPNLSEINEWLSSK